MPRTAWKPLQIQLRPSAVAISLALDRKAELYSLGSFCQISGWVRSAKWHRMSHCRLLYNAIERSCSCFGDTKLL